MIFRVRARRGGVSAALLFLLAALPASAAPYTATAGWTRADVGLDGKGDGIFLGVGYRLAWDHPVFDAGADLQYAQKKGSQPTAFADPVAGFTNEDAAVTLHVIEPGLFIGARVPDLPVVPRLYTGGSISLKVKESWSDFPGIPDRAYGYKETDLIWHVGASVGFGPVTLDVRYSKSMVGQLLDDNQEQPLDGPAKAEDPSAGVREPEIGFKTETLRVGAVFAF